MKSTLFHDPLAGKHNVSDIANRAVSWITVNKETQVLSRFGDDVWDLSPFMKRGNANAHVKRLRWHIAPFTSEESRELKRQIKLFIYSLWSDPIEHLKEPKASTLFKKYRHAVGLCKWLSANKYYSLSEPKAFLDYAAYVGTLDITPATAGMRLQVIEDIYYQSAKIPAIGLAQHPWPGCTSVSLSGAQAATEPMTEIIPDDLVHRIASSAIEFVETNGNHLIEASHAVAKRKAAAISRKVHPDIVSWNKGKEAKRFGFSGVLDLTRQARLLRDCCYIIILLFSGMRQSEVLSLKIGAARPETLPGGTVVHWLDGTVYKTSVSVNGDAASWIVPPIAVKATHVMERLRAAALPEFDEYVSQLEALVQMPHIDVTELKRTHSKLLRAHNDRDSLFLTYDSRTNAWGTVAGKTVSKYLGYFCDHFDIDFNLASHQFRRTFARFVARHAMGDLHYLRHHFKHWSQDMTNFYAREGKDTDLAQEMLHAQLRHRETIITRLLADDTPLLGRQGKNLKEFRHQTITSDNIEDLSSALASDVYIRGNGHSWCVSSPGQQCSGKCVYDRTLCIDCDNAVIEPARHLPVWRELKTQLEAALKRSDLGTPGIERAQNQLRKIDDVIAQMEAARHE